VRFAKLLALEVVNAAAILLVAACADRALRLIKRGTAIAARMPMMTKTTISSISVNPFCFIFVVSINTEILRWNDSEESPVAVILKKDYHEFCFISSWLTMNVLSAQKGFTIVELIVVLTLIALIAAIGVPRWIGQTPNLEAQKQQLISDIRYTQNLAMTHGQRYRINFTLPSSYNITNAAGTAVTNPSTGASTITLASGITLSALGNLPNNLLGFDEHGIPYTDSAVTTTQLATNATITVTANGVNQVITVTPQTGNVQP